MKLPHGDRAVIDRRKLTDYCLSPDHEDGRHKARLFQTTMGVTLDDAHKLIEALRKAAANGEAVVGKCDRYGQRFVIDFAFTGPAGTAPVRSAWIVAPNGTVPRLVTCSIL